MMGNLVLVVDDSLTVCKVIEVVLHREGYEVVSFGSAELAIEWLRSEQARVPDLVLIDLQLPKMDGYTFIRLFHSRPTLCQIPIVILSRCGGFIDLLKGKIVGASDHLSKPFTIERLVSVVRTYLRVPVPV